MNNRMLELAIVAGLKKPPSSDQEYIGDFDWRVFGELVVNECLMIVAKNTYGPYGEYDYSYTNEKAAADDRANAIYDDIKQHFGTQHD